MKYLKYKPNCIFKWKPKCTWIWLSQKMHFLSFLSNHGFTVNDVYVSMDGTLYKNMSYVNDTVVLSTRMSEQFLVDLFCNLYLISSSYDGVLFWDGRLFRDSIELQLGVWCEDKEYMEWAKANTNVIGKDVNVFVFLLYTLGHLYDAVIDTRYNDWGIPVVSELSKGLCLCPHSVRYRPSTNEIVIVDPVTACLSPLALQVAIYIFSIRPIGTLKPVILDGIINRLNLSEPFLLEFFMYWNTLSWLATEIDEDPILKERLNAKYSSLLDNKFHYYDTKTCQFVDVTGLLLNELYPKLTD